MHFGASADCYVSWMQALCGCALATSGSATRVAIRYVMIPPPLVNLISDAKSGTDRRDQTDLAGRGSRVSLQRSPRKHPTTIGCSRFSACVQGSSPVFGCNSKEMSGKREVEGPSDSLVAQSCIDYEGRFACEGRAAFTKAMNSSSRPARRRPSVSKRRALARWASRGKGTESR